MSNASLTRKEFVSFHVGEQEFCVDIMAVREIRGWTAATPLPHAPSFVCGVINLRGTVLPIIDMGVRLNLPSNDGAARRVVIVVAIADELVGLLVDAVSDIIIVPLEAIQATPELACETTRAFVSAMLTVEERLIGVINLDQVPPMTGALAA